jgi:hypothetical protein
MATMTQPAPGTRFRKTIESEVLPPRGASSGEARATEFYDRDLDVVVNALTKEQWAEHIMRVYRAGEKWERGAAPVDNTFGAPFTEEDVRARFGGGKYVLWLYGPPKKQNLVGRYMLELEGQPIINSVPRNGNGTGDGTNSVAIEAMRMYANPEFVRMQMQMVVTAATEAMSLMKSQIPSAQNPLETLRAAKEILGGGNSTGGLLDTLRVLKELGLVGSPEKKGIDEILSLITTLKTSGLINSGVPKADLASTFAANVPMLADRFVAGLESMRMRAEAEERTVRMQRGEMRPGDPNVITVENQNPAQSAAPSPPNGAAPSPSQSATSVTPEVAQAIIAQAHLHRLVAGIKQPDSTGQDMYDYLRNAWPEILDELAKMSKETLLAFFKSREMQRQYFQCEILAEVGEDPRLPKMIEDFLAIAKKDAPPPAEHAAVV